MLKLLALLFFTITLGMAQGANAGPFEDGHAAYTRGDYATALRLWSPLAAQGYAEAQHNLGVMYENGTGVPQDYKEAVRLYRLAAAQGLAEAQNNLGAMYERGRGVPQDYKEAVRWYRLAAAQGNAKAQNNLGVMHERGQGVPQDYARAYMWFNLSAASSSGEDGKLAINNRNKAAAKMTSAQIEQAQEMARKCQASNFKNCD